MVQINDNILYECHTKGITNISSETLPVTLSDYDGLVNALCNVVQRSIQLTITKGCTMMIVSSPSLIARENFAVIREDVELELPENPFEFLESHSISNFRERKYSTTSRPHSATRLHEHLYDMFGHVQSVPSVRVRADEYFFFLNSFALRASENKESISGTGLTSVNSCSGVLVTT